MDALLTIGSYIAWVICLVGWIGIVIEAFGESPLWGVLCICVSPASLIFVIIYWKKAKNPFFLWLLGAVVSVICKTLLLA